MFTGKKFDYWTPYTFVNVAITKYIRSYVAMYILGDYEQQQLLASIPL